MGDTSKDYATARKEFAEYLKSETGDKYSDEEIERNVAFAEQVIKDSIAKVGGETP